LLRYRAIANQEAEGGQHPTIKSAPSFKSFGKDSLKGSPWGKKPGSDICPL
jgi:hypothetical protein